MTKGTIVKCALSVVLAAYLVFAVRFTMQSAASDTCSGLHINVADSVSHGYVTREDIAAELQTMGIDVLNTRRDSINTYNIEQRILAMDNIERVNCVILNNGALRIDVTPLQPMARVFDTKGEDYYINRGGKRMKANTRYRLDVPVVVGDFNTRRTPMLCFPVLDYLDKNPDLQQLVSAIEIRDNEDIVLVPAIKGHVVNIGDTLDLENKFRRLSVFYHKVMPVKGWEFYDTLSVKWRGQVVAKRRHAKETAPEVNIEEHEDVDDMETMSGGPTIPESIPAAADKKKEGTTDKKKEAATDKKKESAADKKNDKKKSEKQAKKQA